MRFFGSNYRHFEINSLQLSLTSFIEDSNFYVLIFWFMNYGVLPVSITIRVTPNAQMSLLRLESSYLVLEGGGIYKGVPLALAPFNL